MLLVTIVLKQVQTKAFRTYKCRMLIALETNGVEIHLGSEATLKTKVAVKE